MSVINRIILVLCGLLFSLLLLEASVRFVPHPRAQQQLSRYSVKGHDRVRVDGMNKFFRETGYYYCRPSAIPGVGYELIPGARAEEKVNVYGMVGKEYPLIKSKNVYRILVLGDSVTEEYSFVKNLEARLNRECPNKVFELWNAGVGGYAVNQYAAYLKYKGFQYNPDMVIVDLCLNDFDLDTIVYYETEKGIVAYDNAGYNLSKAVPLNKWLYLHSYFYRFLISRLERVAVTYERKHADNFADGGKVDEGAVEGRYYLKTIRDMCAKHNVPLVVALFPYLKARAEYDDGESQSHRIMVKSLQEFGINFIDLDEYIPENIRPGLRSNLKLSPDYVHFTPEGYKLAAAAVTPYLIKNYFKAKCSDTR